MLTTPEWVEVANSIFIYKFSVVLKWNNMSTYTQFLYQLVFGSKDHIPFLSSMNQNILFAYIAGILKNKFCHSYIVGGACNHIHIITHIHPTKCPAYLVKDIKEASHVMICRERSLFQNFPGWQVGYSGFTYHISSRESLINYVKNQAEHHKTISYKDELIRLLNEHTIDFTDEYLLT
jgi:putative transposase